MSNVAQIESALKQILEEEAPQLARETGFIERERNLSGADFAQTLVFGWLQDPQITLDGLSQLAQIREVTISAPGLSKRFTPEAAAFLQAILQRVASQHLRAEAVDIPLLRRFSAVMVEDSTQILLPSELAHLWQGCGGSGSMSPAQVKLHTRWDLLSGELLGPRLTDGRVPDSRSPFKDEPLPAESLYLSDLGYFDLGWLKQLARRQQGKKRYFLTRLKQSTKLYTRGGHELVLRGLLPQQEGQIVQAGVLVGAKARIPARLILVKVPKEVAEQRRARLEEEAKDEGREVSEQQWYLAHWTIVITNGVSKRVGLPEVFVLLRLRWQIELLFKRWKSGGQVDEWRSKKPWRILCEVYGKLIGQLIQHWLQLLGCWHDPHRSLVKAAHVVRGAAQRLLAALAGEAQVSRVIESIARQMQSGCRLNTRKTRPNTSQLLLDGLDWPLS